MVVFQSKESRHYVKEYINDTIISCVLYLFFVFIYFQLLDVAQTGLLNRGLSAVTATPLHLAVSFNSIHTPLQ